MNWVLGQFDSSSALLEAAKEMRHEGIGVLDTHTPYPVHGIEQALGIRRSSIGWVAAVGGLTGILTAYGLQLYFNWWEFPLNIANRPPHSPPVYVPVTFELMVLFASLFILTSLVVWYWRLPRPHHPLFDHEPFVQTASTSGWWLSVNTKESDRAKERLLGLGARNVAVLVDEPEVTGGTW